MAMNRVTSSWRGADRRRKERFPQLPPAPDDYPMFPDTSVWPVVFPELPAAPDGGPCDHQFLDEDAATLVRQTGVGRPP